jgi:hypothetical protein
MQHEVSNVVALPSDDERKDINKRKRREAQERYRRKKGADTRERYLAEHATSHEEPWKNLNMSRAKYYRLGLHAVPATDKRKDEHRLDLADMSPLGSA